MGPISAKPIVLSGEPEAERLKALSRQEQAMPEPDTAQIAAELRRARHLQTLATQTARLGSWTYDPLKDELVADRQWQVLHGLPQTPTRIEGLFGAVKEEFVELVRESLDAVFAGTRAEAELEYEAQSGRWLLARLQRMSGEDLGVVTGTAVDITSQKKSEREAQERFDLQQLLLGVVSHDLKAPLQTILTALELLPELGELNEAQAKALRRAKGASGRATRLVWDLLDLARHRLSGEIPLRRCTTKVETVIEEVVGAARLRADEDTRIEVALEGEASAWIDRDRFAQVLVNLIDNALEHGSGGVVRVEVVTEPHTLHMTVHNDGAHIEPERLSHVFEPFEGEGESIRGMGLGLHIVKLLTEAHGGSAAVTSSPREGTTFKTAWPRFDREETSSGA